MPIETATLDSLQEFLNDGGKLNLNAMRPVRGLHHNALLRKDEWEEVDAAVVDVARTELNGIADLVNANLVKPLGGIGTTISTYEQLGDMDDADVSMDGVVDGNDDRVTFTPQSIPVPILHKDFSLSLRHLEASRRMGESLDTTQVRVATRKVRDTAEAMLFNGHAKDLGGFKIYGYTNHPKRTNDTAANFGGGDFGTPGNGYKTITGMINRLAANGYNGPFGVYVSRVQYGELLALYGNNDLSELMVIKNSIPNISFIKASDALADGVTVVVQLTLDVVDLAIAQDIAAVQWDEKGGMLAKFRVMACLVPRVKFASNNKTGLATATGC